MRWSIAASPASPVIFLVLSAILFSGCGREPLHQSQAYVFGTLVDVSIYGEAEPRARELTNYILQDFQSLHKQLHAWQQGSELSQLNQAFADGKSLEISPALTQIITNASVLSEQTSGLFNPAIGGLIKQWGFQRDEFTPISIDAKAIDSLVKANPKMTDIMVENNIASSRNAAVKLDLGGYAKGYALDGAARYLRSQNVRNALINIGGNIIALGKHGKNPWRVGIQHPRKPGPIATLDLNDGWAIGTSGDYQRYFELGGKRHCHVIDPRSGYPAQGTQAVTILVPPGEQAGTLSDVASKPIFISPANSKAIAEKMGIADFMIIDASGNISVSKNMAKRLQWSEKSVTPAILP